MLNEKIHRYLFSKGTLIGEKRSEHAFAARFALASIFNISITSGQEYAHENMISFAADMLGEFVPEPFYRNFPHSVRELTSDQRLFDQLCHYAITYGSGDFSEAGYSLFEENFERLAFREETAIKKFVILNEEEALAVFKEYIEDMLKGSRPLSDMHYDLVKSFVIDYHYEIQNCVCKDTAIRLLLDIRDSEFVKFIALSDVIQFVDLMNYHVTEAGISEN